MPVLLVSDITVKKVHPVRRNKGISFPESIRFSVLKFHPLVAFFQVLRQKLPRLDIDLCPVHRYCGVSNYMSSTNTYRYEISTCFLANHVYIYYHHTGHSV